MRKFFGFKSIISALICALCAAFQAKAQTTVKTVNISTVGSASITSITDANTGATYDASNATASNSIQIMFTVGGYINNLNAITSGEQITLPITLAAGSHFGMPSLTFSPSTLTSDGTATGTPIFDVSYSNGSIILTALPAIAGFTGRFDFSASGTGMLSVNTSSTAYMLATSSTFTLNGNSYTIANAPYSMGPVNSNAVILSSPAALANGATGYIGLDLYNIYNTYLLGGATIYSSDATWNTNVVVVATIPANSNIVPNGVSFINTPTDVITYVMPTSSGGSSMSGTGLSLATGSSTAAFSTVTLAPDLTMSQIEAALQPGERAIVQNSDGSYTIAVNYGTLLNGRYGYPSNATVTNAETNAVIQKAIAAGLNAVVTNMQFQVNFTDPTAKQTATVTIANNMPAVFSTGGSPMSLTDQPTVVASNGQTTISVHYVDLNGNNLQTILSKVGYPVGNAAGKTPDAPLTITPLTITGYTLVTDAATLATATGIPAPTSSDVEQIMTTTDAFVTAFPSTGTNDYYYVYKGSPMPITGLQLSAQVQANNDVQLTWGTLTEINSQSFTVQRSSDGGKTWITVGIQPTQAANGNSSVPLTYQLTDPNVQVGEYEYRVVETDVDGATTTSNVVQISITGGSQVYPNPANTLLNVKLPAGANSVPYRLISADGKIVLSGTITNTSNYGQISVAGIASDIYFLQITVNSAMQTYEVRIQH